MRYRGRALVPSICLLLAWVVSQALVAPASEVLLPDPLHPYTQLVVLAPGAKSDIVSIVPVFVRALILCVAGVAIAEISKILSSRLAYSVSRHAVIFGFQLVLALDTLRFHAYDWFLYTLHVAGLVPLNADAFFAKKLALPLSSPWPSLLAAITVAMYVYFSLERSLRTDQGHEPNMR